MNTPRLFADMAAAPTPTERRAARSANRAAQLDMFAPEPTPAAPVCPVCAGAHTEQECRHGTAPSLLDCPRRYTLDEIADRAECFDCDRPRAEHAHRLPDPDACAELTFGTSARVRRYVANFGSTICPDCRGDMLDEAHGALELDPGRHGGSSADLMPWRDLDMIELLQYRRIGPSPCDR